MISVLECAQISGHIYHPEKHEYAGTMIQPLDPKKLHRAKEGWNIVNDFDPDMRPNGHIYAALYLQVNQSKITDAVIAIRGTDNLFNDIVDMISWFQDVIGTERHSLLPAYTADIMHFFMKCEALLKRAKLSYVYPTITGHSLGGALAQLYNLRYIQTTAITFNSPGCAQMPGIHPDRSHLVHEFSAHWGIINRIGKPVNSPTWIDVPEQAQVAEKLIHAWNNKLDHTATTLQDQAFADVKDSPLTSLQPNHFLGSLGAGALLKATDIEQAAQQAGGNLAAYHAMVEQHKIANMVRALQQTQNRTIAHQSFNL